MKKLVITIAAAFFAAQSCNMKQSVDFIGHNGVVYTVDSSFSVVEAFAVKEGLFVEAGSNETILSKYKSKNICDFNTINYYAVNWLCHDLWNEYHSDQFLNNSYGSLWGLF